MTGWSLSEAALPASVLPAPVLPASAAWAGVAGALVGLAVAVLAGPPSGRLLRERFGVGREWGAPRGRSGSSRTDSPWVRTLRWLVRTVTGRRKSKTSGSVSREAYTVLGAELRAGRSAQAALTAAALVSPSLEPAARAARAGGDVTSALLGLDTGGRALALAWAVGEQAGIGLAALVDRVSDGIADDLSIRREVQAQLAGPRATARMLAGLPAIGVLLGSGFGDPLGFLLGSGYGLACLAGGVVLAVLGLYWVERLAERAGA